MAVIGANHSPMIDISSFAHMIAPSNEPSIDSINQEDFLMKDDEPSLFDEENTAVNAQKLLPNAS